MEMKFYKQESSDTRGEDQNLPLIFVEGPENDEDRNDNPVINSDRRDEIKEGIQGSAQQLPQLLQHK